MLKVILKALFFCLLKSPMPFWFLAHCVCLVFSLAHTRVISLFPVFWNFKVACFDVFTVISIFVASCWRAFSVRKLRAFSPGKFYFSGNFLHSEWRKSSSQIRWTSFLIFSLIFQSLVHMSLIKKINFFNFYNSFKNSGYLYLYILLFMWHLDHALWMQYLLFLHLKNELQILKSILISTLSLFFFSFFFSIILHKDFPPVSANPWVLTYLRVINYYNLKENSAWKGLLLMWLPRE